MPFYQSALTRIASASLLLCAILSCQTRTIPPPPPGSTIAPLFALSSLNEETQSLTESRGKIVLVHFWATWCLSCVHELTTLQHLYSQLDQDNFELYAIAVDDAWSAIRATQEAHQFSFPILFDEQGSTRVAYGVNGLPQSFLLGRSGEFLNFPQPDGGKIVSRTVGAQSWDDKKTVAFFKSLTDG